MSSLYLGLFQFLINLIIKWIMRKIIFYRFTAGCGWVWGGVTFFLAWCGWVLSVLWPFSDWVWVGLTFFRLHMDGCGWVWVGVGEWTVYNYPFKTVLKLTDSIKLDIESRYYNPTKTSESLQRKRNRVEG